MLGRTPQTPLERALLVRVMADISEARQLGYNPTIFVGMIGEHGVVDACRRVIMELPANQAPYGFGKLWELRRLDLTAENTVLQERWRSLFEDAVRQRAAERLQHFRDSET